MCTKCIYLPTQHQNFLNFKLLLGSVVCQVPQGSFRLAPPPNIGVGGWVHSMISWNRIDISTLYFRDFMGEGGQHQIKDMKELKDI